MDIRAYVYHPRNFTTGNISWKYKASVFKTTCACGDCSCLIERLLLVEAKRQVKAAGGQELALQTDVMNEGAVNGMTFI